MEYILDAVHSEKGTLTSHVWRKMVQNNFVGVICLLTFELTWLRFVGW